MACAPVRTGRMEKMPEKSCFSKGAIEITETWARFKKCLGRLRPRWKAGSEVKGEREVGGIMCRGAVQAAARRDRPFDKNNNC